MKFKQPVSMKVTFKQYREDLEKPLKALGYEWGSHNTPEYDLNNQYCILTTDYFGNDKYIGGINYKNGHFIPEYSPKLFIAIAAMTEGDDWMIGLWVNGYIVGTVRGFLK